MSTSHLADARLQGSRSQAVFDWLLRTLAEPGSLHTIAETSLVQGLPAVAIPALALADVDVVVSVDDLASHDLADAIRGVTGCTVGSITDADLVVLTEPDPAVLARCATGSALEPERGAKVAIGVEAIHLETAVGVGIDVSGPGVPGIRRIHLLGPDPYFFRTLQHLNRAFPAGVDCWFVTPEGDAVALPRSTRLTIHEEH